MLKFFSIAILIVSLVVCIAYAEDEPNQFAFTVPSSGATVTGLTTLTVISSGYSGINQVRFFLDGSTIATAGGSSPHSTTWNSASVVDGIYTLSARAINDGGGTIVDTTGPTIVVANTSVIDDFSVNLTVVDNSGTEDGGGEGDGGEGEETTPPAPERRGGGSPDNDFEDIFEELPRADREAQALLDGLTLSSFEIIQTGEPTRNFNEQNIARVSGQKYLTMRLPYQQVPDDVLKTIGVTVFDPRDRTSGFSFVLRADDQAQAYTATVEPLGRNALFPLNVHVIDFKNQRLKKLSGFMQVAGVGFISLGPVAQTVAKTVVPIALSAGAVAGGVSLLITSLGIKSLYDIYLLAAQLFGAVFGDASLRRRRRPWGTVYDAVTKQPLDPAYVSVRKNGKEVASAITDLDGRYSLLLPLGTYELVVSKSHYQFPTTFLKSKTADEMYDNLYHGGPITAGGDQAIALNIPLDPVGFDWNEFIKQKGNLFKIYTHSARLRARIFNIVYAVGFTLAGLMFIFRPSLVSLGILVIYILLAAIRLWRGHRRRVLKVQRASTNEPVAFAVIKVYLTGLNQEVKRTITDSLGRFNFLLRPGNYYWTVEEKQADGIYRKIFQSPPTDLSAGVLAGNIVVP